MRAEVRTLAEGCHRTQVTIHMQPTGHDCDPRKCTHTGTASQQRTDSCCHTVTDQQEVTLLTEPVMGTQLMPAG